MADTHKWNMSVAGITHQEIERGVLNFGSAFKMIMGWTMPNIIKISPRDRGVPPSPLHKIPYVLCLPNCRRNS